MLLIDLANGELSALVHREYSKAVHEESSTSFRVSPLLVAQTAKAFEENLKKAGVPHEVFIYPGQGHAFMNASEEGIKRKLAGGHAAHNEEAVDLAWKRTAEWFNKYLK